MKDLSSISNKQLDVKYLDNINDIINDMMVSIFIILERTNE